MSETVAKRQKVAHNTANEVVFIYKGQPKIQIPAGVSHVTTSTRVRSIKQGYFEYCKPLRNLYVLKNVKTIGDSAFDGCSKLAEVKFEVGLITIGRWAFRQCMSLTQVILPEGLTTVGSSAFDRCEGLQTLSAPSTMEEITGWSFSGCSSLVEVILPRDGRIKTIGTQSFQGCVSLVSISLPQSLESIRCGAFSGCVGLLGVELCSNTKVTLHLGCFHNCKRLVNISIPSSSTKYDRSQDAFSGVDWLQANNVHLKDRYEQLPVHRLCYHSEEATVDELKLVLDSIDTLDNGRWEDVLGLTPLHVFATSPNPSVDILECLLDRYPIEIVTRTDKGGQKMMDYLLKHSVNKSSPLLRLVLQRAVVDAISSWGMQGKWRSELSRRLESMSGENGIDAQRQSFMNYADYCARLEMTSLVELALWKMRMSKEEKSADSESSIGRSSCRYQNGADVVVGNVCGYLWNGKSGSSTVLSIFPIFSSPE